MLKEVENITFLHVLSLPLLTPIDVREPLYLLHGGGGVEGEGATAFKGKRVYF